MKKQAEEWLNAASDDLKVIDKIIDDEILTNMVAFHSQQAIEKSFKSILEEFESKVPRIHNLIKLKEQSKNIVHSGLCEKPLKFLERVHAKSAKALRRIKIELTFI